MKEEWLLGAFNNLLFKKTFLQSYDFFKQI